MNDEVMDEIEAMYAKLLSSDEELTEVVDTEIKIVDGWANSIAVNDNDMIYLRKKNGIMYVMKVEPHLSGTWEKLDPKAVPVISDVQGAKIEDKLAEFVKGTIEQDQKSELKPIPNLTIGWYQDDKANLYKYLGGGVWDSEIGLFGKLLVKAEAGELEYLG